MSERSSTRASAARSGLRRRAFSLAALGAALCVAVSVTAGCERSDASGDEAMIAVAASLRGVMPELTKGFVKAHPGVEISATYGATGDLRKQVEGGAPIDGVLFASAGPVDQLVEAKLLEPSSRRVQAQNKLVLIAPKGAKHALTWETIEQLPAGEKLAIGQPGAVPAGQYARDALQKLGKWEAVEPHLVFGGDVSAVLAYARRGEAALAIVYKTETHGIDDIVVLDEAEGSWAPRAEVVSGVVTQGKGAAQAKAFLDFCASPEGQAILTEFGFGKP